MTTLTVHVPAGFLPRFAAVYKPMDPPKGVEASPKYGMTFEAHMLPEEVRATLGYTSALNGGKWKSTVKERPEGEWVARATSRMPPLVVADSGSRHDMIGLESLLWFCDNVNMPRDWVFRERAINLLVEVHDFNTAWIKGCGLILRAVQIEDLDEGFLRRELKRRMEEFEC